MKLAYLIQLSLLINLLVGCKQKRIDSNSLKIDTSLLKKLSSRGKVVFESDCKMCHGKNKTDDMLKNVVSRLGVGYLQLYITKQDSLIKAKNKYALEIKKEFGNAGNSHNFNYTKTELASLIVYLNE